MSRTSASYVRGVLGDGINLPGEHTSTIGPQIRIGRNNDDFRAPCCKAGFPRYGALPEIQRQRHVPFREPDKVRLTALESVP